MPQRQIEETLERYAAAFSANDADAIAAFWLIPAIISVGAVTTPLLTYEALRNNIEALCTFYRNQGVARARVSLSSATLPLSDCAQISARYDLEDATGGDIVGWSHHYTLRHIGRDWRIAIAIADEEVAAWQARGTPLGG